MTIEELKAIAEASQYTTYSIVDGVEECDKLDVRFLNTFNKRRILAMLELLEEARCIFEREVNILEKDDKDEQSMDEWLSKFEKEFGEE